MRSKLIQDPSPCRHVFLHHQKAYVYRPSFLTQIHGKHQRCVQKSKIKKKKNMKIYELL